MEIPKPNLKKIPGAGLIGALKKGASFAGKVNDLFQEGLAIKEVFLNHNSDTEALVVDSPEKVAELKAQGKDAVYLPGPKAPDAEQLAANLKYDWLLLKGLFQAILAEATDGDHEPNE